MIESVFYIIKRIVDYVVAVYRNDRIAFGIGIALWVLGKLMNLPFLFWLGLIAYAGFLVAAERTGQKLGIEKDFLRAFKAAKTAETGTASTSALTVNAEVDASGSATPAATDTIVKDEGPGPIISPANPEPAKEPELVKPKPVKEPKKKPEMPLPLKKGVSFVGEFLKDEEKMAGNFLDIEKIESEVKGKIKGQDQAVDVVLNTLKRVAAGIRTKPESPLSVFLFLGPTGTGKTEIVKQISKATGRHMVRFDMPNYSTEAGIWELIGSPPGYIGSEKAGRLTGEIQANPNAVLLLDEIEKAHPKMWDPFLRVLDEGKLRDQSKGFTANFNDVMIFLTSNLMAFEEWTENETALRNKLLNEGYFRPELVNRIDRIVMFKQFTKEILSGIVTNMIVGFCESFLKTNKINAHIKIERNLIEHVIGNVDLKFGVRDAERFVEKYIGDAMADAYFRVAGKEIGDIKISAVNNKVEVEI